MSRAHSQAKLTADLKTSLGSRYFFVHHSVGGNLIEGLGELAAAMDLGAFELVYTPEDELVEDGPMFAHINAGQNTVPKSKVDGFGKHLRELPKLKPDMAFMKLCYVDFHPTIDVVDLFGYYRRAIEELKHELPGTVFGHVTVPLTTYPTEAKWRMFRVIGKEVWEDAANLKRYEFSERLREAFASDPIYDLARAESTYPDGSRESQSLDGKPYFALVPSYTDDGGHLNRVGRQSAAREMLPFLAQAAKRGC